VSTRHPKQRRNERENNRGPARHRSRRGERDEPVTVVCSRYEKRKGSPSSLIRTCQEPGGARCPTVERSGGSESKGGSTADAPGAWWSSPVRAVVVKIEEAGDTVREWAWAAVVVVVWWLVGGEGEKTWLGAGGRRYLTRFSRGSVPGDAASRGAKRGRGAWFWCQRTSRGREVQNRRGPSGRREKHNEPADYQSLSKQREKERSDTDLSGRCLCDCYYSNAPALMMSLKLPASPARKASRPRRLGYGRPGMPRD
jgi:hypothetical protein